jgi:hypothetical protein
MHEYQRIPRTEIEKHGLKRLSNFAGFEVYKDDIAIYLCKDRDKEIEIYCMKKLVDE